MYKSSETEIVLPMERSHSWSSAPASKAGEGQTSVSSNLTLSGHRDTDYTLTAQETPC